MKQWKSRIGLILLTLFSFYYTQEVTNVLRQKDPLMKEIIEQSSQYEEDSINAQIIGNQMISGIKGKKVDFIKTYDSMKQYGTYNESYISLTETKPVISIDDYYDKYIIKGNQKKKEVSIVIPVVDENINNVLWISNQKKVPITFFVDGTYLEKHLKTIQKNETMEWEILSYQKEYNQSLMRASNSYLNSITKQSYGYCYSQSEQKELLEYCKSEKMHTIKPTIMIHKDLYQQVKKNLQNGMILSIELNSCTEKELSITLDYIKEKGYKIVILHELINE